MYGDPNTTTGGKALAFFATQRINLRKVKVQKEDGITEEEGIKINVKVAKNRCAYDNPYKATSYTALFGKGIDSVRELAQLAQDAGFATSGSWIYFDAGKNPSKENFNEWNGEELKWNGKAKFLDFIRDDEDFQIHLKGLLRGTVKVDSLSSEEINRLQNEETSLQTELNELGIDLDQE
jgi:recombination protein RecA